MREWRIERCKLREKWGKGFWEKIRAWESSDVRITNQTGWETIPSLNWLLVDRGPPSSFTCLNVVSFVLIISTFVLGLFRACLVVFRSCTYIWVLPAVFSCRLDIPVWKTLIRFQKSFTLGMLCHSLHLNVFRLQLVPSLSSVLSDWAVLFRNCRMQNESNAVLWAVCRLVHSRARAVCPESDSGLLGLFCCWLFNYLIITIASVQFSDNQSISFTLRCNMMECDAMHEICKCNTF